MQHSVLLTYRCSVTLGAICLTPLCVCSEADWLRGMEVYAAMPDEVFLYKFDEWVQNIRDFVYFNHGRIMRGSKQGGNEGKEARGGEKWSRGRKLEWEGEREKRGEWGSRGEWRWRVRGERVQGSERGTRGRVRWEWEWAGRVSGKRWGLRVKWGSKSWQADGRGPVADAHMSGVVIATLTRWSGHGTIL